MLWIALPHIARFMWPIWGPSGSCRPQVGPMNLAIRDCSWDLSFLVSWVYWPCFWEVPWAYWVQCMRPVLIPGHRQCPDGHRDIVYVARDRDSLIYCTPIHLTWISNYTYYKVWDEITYPFPNFNWVTVAVWEWIRDFITHLKWPPDWKSCTAGP